jgi:hypothetical protein
MSESQTKPTSRRRGFLLGAAVAGAATAAVVTLPKGGESESLASEKAPPAPENGGGYRVTDHVKRYYKSTLI